MPPKSEQPDEALANTIALANDPAWLSSKTIPELEATNNALFAESRRLREVCVSIQKVIGEKTAVADALRKLTPEQVALVQAIKPVGIESAEQFGKI